FVVWDYSVGGKWIQLLREIAPDIRRVGVIYNPDTATYAAGLIDSAKAAGGGDVALIECPARDDNEIEAAASLLGREPRSGLLIIPGPFTNARRDQIISQAARFGLPIIMSAAASTSRGALISYTYAFDAMMRQPVSYIDRILKGQAPGELPVQAPIKYELSI